MFKDIPDKLDALPRFWKRIILVAFDFFALLTVLWLAYSARLNIWFVPSFYQVVLMLLAPITAIPIFIRMGLYRAVIRYLPERAFWTIVQAMTLATLAWVAVIYLSSLTGIAGAPRSVPLIYWAMGIAIIAGSRFAAKWFLLPTKAGGVNSPPLLIYGAGSAGVQLASALQTHAGRFVGGFIDDDQGLWGHDVSGIRVYGPDHVEALVANTGIKEIILSMPSINSARRQAIYAQLSKINVTLRTLPSITDLASGKYMVNQIKEIEVDDLLGRSSVPPDPELISKMIKNRVVMVSGAGGSIGSELTKLIARNGPAKLVMLEANEHALYQIDRALKDIENLSAIPVLGSVCNRELVDHVISSHKVDAVFHAAAHKHVTLVEANVIEGINNNVFGTRTIAEAAFAHNVANFVLISTDKAVHPVSVMGASKRWAELIVRDLGRRAEQKNTSQLFCAVRFGNVLGSNGSVVPLFREQIAKGGPITLTDEGMTRYFMSIHEAVELIVQAGALSKDGDIFLLEMGEPVRIRDLAENMVRLAGLELRTKDNPNGDIEISIIGARRGEKVNEELFYEPGQATRTRQPKILRARRGELSRRDIKKGLATLEELLAAGDEERIRDFLFEFVTV
ncbi:UDP-N-acetylglucosamine 4,6-dehydratase [hydrothermal vent metagenome]|uniref:UDP-N-acetylglucosamine 4,6-dehydratase n=1 Tax=hydrothermal vent metagenome TaxID=652676 RepID=A0A3B0TEF9_9ZZZZ